MKHFVFVYGTLKRGQHNHGVIADQKFVSEGCIPGSLYIRGLPFFKNAGNGYVHGELYRVDDECLARLDRLEGYNRANPELSHYKRIVISNEYIERPEPGSDMEHTLLDDVFVYEYNYPIEEKYLNKEGIYRG